MANRYWTAASVDNFWANTANWSTSSGGLGGASVPTSADAVIFDSNSGTGTAQLNGDRDALSLNMTGSTKSINGFYNLNIYGNCTFNASTARITSVTLRFIGGGTYTLNTNNAPIQNVRIQAGIPGNPATLNINGTLRTSAALIADQGTLNTNNNTITVLTLTSYNSGTLNLGSSTVTLTKSTTGDIIYASSTINYGTSTIVIAATAATTTYFASPQSFYNIDIATSSSVTIFPTSHSFNNISNSVQPVTLKFPASYTQTFSNFSLSGTSGNLVNLNTTSGTGTFTLSKSSGIVSRNYLSITNSAATGGASWFAGANSTDGGGNTGWIFASPSAGLLTFW
jgi:hypothetical protein